MNPEFIGAIEELERERGIDKEVLFQAIEAALISAYKRNFDSAQNVRIVMERETGDIQVLEQKEVVEEVKNEQEEISHEDAKQIRSDYEIGDIVEHEVTPKNFGRIAAQTAKQVVIQRIREAEREIVFEEYVHRQDDVITGIIQRTEQNNVIVDLGKVEAVIPPTEQMESDKYDQGERIKAYVVEVKKTTKEPYVMLSRTHPGLIKRLFELEVPEIFQGVVEVKSVSREAGQRSKIAVHSRQDEVDPVGSCVGPKGSRVQTIVKELNGEKIDIVKWSDDPKELISNSLSPTKVMKVDIDEKNNYARVVVPDDQLSLAIGKEGQNARLAAKLTNWKIDILSESKAYEQSETGNIEDVPNDASPEYSSIEDPDS
ncbi:transcription termination factor NusA [Natranaerofaba carboxydovora]|uniref:transcription termination factor NusA n=1 Tax=Natranaerofaba carboxydovora TaxID=2742683 RepID=UPI001F13016E|nr:transcription termination factor NusA [Natranaerofaba carboxydovora]UMZ73407.1 Transcription termination/antitermination protein NusA [Natranaerofaba carboxydovora]